MRISNPFKFLIKYLASLIRAPIQEEPYSFQVAKKYWQNVPRAQGANPFNSINLQHLSDKQLIEQFLSEVKIAQQKHERNLGYSIAEKISAAFESPLILDYGSGIGFYGYEMLTRHDKSRVIFADINQSNLSIISKILNLLGYKDRFETRLISNPGADDISIAEPVDMIISMGVLHHTPYALEIVKNLSTLQPAGRVFLAMLYNDRFKSDMAIKSGRKLNTTSFGQLTDPMVATCANPFSDAYDITKAKKLFAQYKLIQSTASTRHYDIYHFEKL